MTNPEKKMKVEPGIFIAEFNDKVTVIEKKLNELNTMILENKSFIVNYCSNLRSDINQESEKLIQIVHNLNRSLNSKIDDFEQKQLKKLYTMLPIDKNDNEVSSYLKQLRSFTDDHEQRSLNLSEVKLIDEINLAVNYELMFNEKKVKLDEAIKIRELLKFEKVFENKFQIGSLELISSKRSEKLNFKAQYLSYYLNILKPFERSSFEICNLDDAENEKLVAIYFDLQNNLTLTIINNETIGISHRTHVSKKFFKIKTFRNLIFYYYINNGGSKCLSKRNSDLKELENCIIGYPVVSICVNESNVFTLIEFNEYRIELRDFKLKLIKVYGQFHGPDKPFYFGKDLISFDYKNEKFYCHYGDRLEIINSKDGKLNKKIQVRAENFKLDRRGNFLVISGQSCSLYAFSMDGFLYETISFKNLPTYFDFFVDKRDNFRIYKNLRENPQK